MARRRRLFTKGKLAKVLMWTLGLSLAALVLTITIVVYRLHRPLYGALTPKDFEIHGIDVSHHQGEVDYARVKQATVFGRHIRFIFAKCTEGCTKVDKRYERNRREVRRNGFCFGAYHFYVPGRPAEEQADNFIRHSHLKSGDLVPVLDVEKVGAMKSDKLRAEVLRWLEIVGKHYNCRPILYTYQNFKELHLSNSHLDGYPLWEAMYLPSAAIPDKEWTFFQYTRHGHVAGVRDGLNDYVDLDVFNGTAEDLKSLTLGDF